MIIIGIMISLATISMIAILTKNILVTFVSPIIIILSCVFSFSQIGSHVLVYMPYIIGQGAITRFAPKSNIILGIVSSLLTFIITIGVSMLYVRHEDIK